MGHLAGSCGFLIACHLLIQAGAGLSALNNAGHAAGDAIPDGPDGALIAWLTYKDEKQQKAEEQAQANETAKRERQVAWDREVCSKTLQEMGYDKKMAQIAIETTGSSDVNECITWISEKVEKEQKAKEEKRRREREAREAAAAEEEALMNEVDEDVSEQDDDDEEDEFAGWGDSDSDSGGWGSDSSDDGHVGKASSEPRLMRYRS